MQIISNKRWNGLQNQIKALQSSVNLQQFSNITAHIYPSWQVFKDIETWRIVDDISSVVNKLANTAAMIPVYGYDPQGEDLPEGNKLVDFLSNLTFSQRLELFSFLFLTDECFIYKETLEFGPNAGVKSIHFLHPNFVTLVLTNGFPAQVAGYIYRDTQAGVELFLKQEEVIFIKGFNPTSDFQTKWRGVSKVQLLSETLTRLKANKSNSVAQMQNGGLPGIVFEKDADFDAIETKGLRKENFSRFLKNSDNKGAPYFSAGELGYIQLGLTLVDLDSAELAKIDLKKICNAWGLSDVLMNNDTASTESNVKEMVRLMYTNAVRPKLVLVEEAFTRQLVPDFKVKGFVKFDLSDIPELQENMLEKMNALAASPVMIPNDVREASGFDRLPDPLMDKVYLKTGYQPIDDFNEIEPIE